LGLSQIILTPRRAGPEWSLHSPLVTGRNAHGKGVQRTNEGAQRGDGLPAKTEFNGIG
jgi:hypothetical protein